LRQLYKIWIAALLLSAVFVPSHSTAQEDVVKLIFAETVMDAEGLANTTKAKGNVHFEHNKTHLYCDSALFYRDLDLVYAYSNVHINQGDTINLFCDSLIYDGNTEISKLQGHVRMRDSEYKLVTDSLEYNGANSVGHYKNHAVITSIEEDLKLTSVKGYYHANEKTFFFKDSVLVTGESYSLESDTLEFRTNTSSAHFHGPTKILMDSSRVECIAGVYYTGKGLAQLWDGAWLYEKERVLYADSLIYNEKSEVGEGHCNVMLHDSTENIKFLSDYLWKSGGNDTLILEENARILQFSSSDTLILMADSIFHYQDTAADFNESIAQTNVGIINGDITVRCDSAYFSERDSIVKFHYTPVMWSKETQMTADSIFATYYDDDFHEMYLYNNAFIATEHDTLHYDQIKGKMMTAWIDSSKIQKVYIESNAETLYYVTEDDKDSLGNDVKSISGMNRIDCNEIYIYFENSEIQNIAFIEDPTGTYYAMNILQEKDTFLKGFLWKMALKPKAPLIE
jgi:lipopolysaccharide export system protein LptA